MYKMGTISIFTFILIAMGTLKGQEKISLNEKNVRKLDGIWLLYSADLTAADGSFNRFEFNPTHKIDDKDLGCLNKYIDPYIQSIDHQTVSSGKGKMGFIAFSREQYYEFAIGYIIVSSKGRYFLMVKMSNESEMFAFELTDVNKKFDKMNLVHRDGERVSSFQFWKQD